MIQHTPGPWKGDGSYVYAPDGAIIAIVQNPGSRESDYPLVANRDLIAAAPELLKALMVQNYMGGDEHGGYCICPRENGAAPDKEHATGCVMARAAIRKATGEA